MKSQRFGLSKLPFRKADRSTQPSSKEEGKALTNEEQRLPPSAISTPPFALDSQQKPPTDEKNSLPTSSISATPFTSQDSQGEPPNNEEESPPSSPVSTSASASLHDPAKLQTQEEQLAFIEPAEEVNSDGEDCEFHVYETRYDTRGDQVILRAGTKSGFKPPRRKSHRACLVLDRTYNRQGKLLDTHLIIQSKHILKALRDVIGSYYGLDFTAEYISIEEPTKCLFHYRSELKLYLESSEAPQLRSQVGLCLEYMERSLHQEIKIFDSLCAKVNTAACLEYRYLWTVFKPGCLVYNKVQGVEMVTRLRYIDLYEDDDDNTKAWELMTEGLSTIRGQIGLTGNIHFILEYKGRRPLLELEATPLHLHPEETQIRERILERGRKYLSLCGTHHCFYSGVATMRKTSLQGSGPTERILVCIYNRNRFNLKAANFKLKQIENRIMLDDKECGCQDNYYNGGFVSGTKKFSSGREAIAELSDETIMTCNPALQGFSLETKRWGRFLVSNISEVIYNDKAFDALLFPEKKKTLLSSLLKQQACQPEDRFDDLIRGKGKGLVFLLYGPPGVGKTYTAGKHPILLIIPRQELS